MEQICNDTNNDIHSSVIWVKTIDLLKILDKDNYIVITDILKQLDVRAHELLTNMNKVL